MITFWIVELIHIRERNVLARYLVPLIGKADEYKARDVVVKKLEKTSHQSLLLDTDWRVYSVEIRDGVAQL